MRHTILLAVCIAITMASMASYTDAYEPMPNLDAAVGIVWENGIQYALTFTADGGVSDTAWNVTNMMAPISPHTYTIDDAEWGNNMGYTHILLDGVRHGVVAALDGPPVLVQVGDAEPYMDNIITESGEVITDEPGSVIRVRVESGLIVATQTWWTGDGQNTTDATHHFQSVHEPPTEAPRPDWYGKSHSAVWDPTMIIVGIRGQNYAVVNMVDGPPVLADAMKAAALGLGDISGIVPVDYVRLDIPPRMQAMPVDESAAIHILADMAGGTYAAVWWNGDARVYDITNPLEPRAVDMYNVVGLDAPWGVGDAPHIWFESQMYGNVTLHEPGTVPAPYIREFPAGTLFDPFGRVYDGRSLYHHDALRVSVLDMFDRLPGDAHPSHGTSIAYANLVHAGRAGHAIPVWFDSASVEERARADGVWAVVAYGDTVTLAETRPDTEVAVAYDAGRTYVMERVAGTNTVLVYDIADPASPEPVDAAVPYDGEWGAPGQAITHDMGDTTWALVPVRDEHIEGEIMVISSVSATVGKLDQIYAGATVRNVHYEPIVVRIDRVDIGHSPSHKIILEQSHKYSAFESPGDGAVRISGPVDGGYFGPSVAYPAVEEIKQYDHYHDRPEYYGDVNIIYSAEKWGRVLAYTQVEDYVRLAPGESERISVVVYDPCKKDDGSISMPNACGLGGAALSHGYVSSGNDVVLEYTGPFGTEYFLDVRVTLVADGYPERAATVGIGDYSEVWR